jgi:ribosomal subunit interface protein
MKLQSVDKTITVQSSTVDLGDAFRQHAEDCIRKVASKYFNRLNTAAVHVNKEGVFYRCTVNIQMGALKMMSGEVLEKEVYRAFNQALEKCAKQLRRHKRELREDKGERLDKTMVLDDGLNLRKGIGNGIDSGGRELLPVDDEDLSLEQVLAKVEPDDYTRAITQSGNRKIPITVNGESRNPEIRHLPAEAAE